MEIEAIANLARYHRKSSPKKKHEPYQSLPRRFRQVIDQLHPLLRLAVALYRRMIGKLKPSHPNDDCALELWSLDLKKEAFEMNYGLKLVAQLEP